MTATYEEGVPLAEADYEFAPPSLVRKHQKALKASEMKAAVAAAKAHPPDPDEPAAMLMLRISQVAMPALLAPRKVRQEMQEILLKKRCAGEYLALASCCPGTSVTGQCRCPSTFTSRNS
jgi:hypothetical protein